MSWATASGLPAASHMWASIAQRLGRTRRVASSFWLQRHRGLKKTAEPATESPETADLYFEAGPAEPILFPHLLEPGKRAVLVGVDPDIHGAVAVLNWQNGSAGWDAEGGGGNAVSNDSSSSSSSVAGRPLEALEVTVHDIPVDVWEMGTRAKRQPDGAALMGILQELLGRGEVEGVAVGAVLEHTTPQHICGKYAWYGMGYSFGLLTGLLTSQGIPHHRVDAAAWKRHLGLYRLGKDGSLALARQLFPQALPLLKRKKDHGRAEALLIAAWALGVRMVPVEAPAKGSGESRAGEGATQSEGSNGRAAGAQGSGADVDAGAGAPPKKRRVRKKAAEPVSSTG